MMVSDHHRVTLHPGINVKFVNVLNLAEIDAAIDDSVKVFYCETISNPSYAVPDFEGTSCPHRSLLTVTIQLVTYFGPR